MPLVQKEMVSHKKRNLDKGKCHILHSYKTEKRNDDYIERF